MRPFQLAILALALVACAESTAPPHGRGPTPPPNAVDASGTYALQSVKGIIVPASIPAVYSTVDTLYGGCLTLGPATPTVETTGDSSWTILQGTANESWFFVKSEADHAAADRTYCPAQTANAGGGSRYQIAGDSGTVYVCGAHACSETPFVVAGTGASRTLQLLNTTGTEVFASR